MYLKTLLDVQGTTKRTSILLFLILELIFEKNYVNVCILIDAIFKNSM